MKIRQPFTSNINEPCNGADLVSQGYFNIEPPAALVQTLKAQPLLPPLLSGLRQDIVSKNRLRGDLRQLAQKHNPSDLLVKAALKFLESPSVGSAQWEEANALADLAVTGRIAYKQFVTNKPQENELINSVVRSNSAVAITQITIAVRNALNRAYSTAWVLQGYGNRAEYGWIAVSAEDDAPHRPVNVPGPTLGGRKVQQFNLDVNVKPTANANGKNVTTRFSIFGNNQVVDKDFDINGRVLSRSLPIEPTPVIPLDGKLIFYIHGHSSRLEEASDLAEQLVAQGFILISMDLPGSGYASPIDHLQIGAVPSNPDVNILATTGPFPALEFIEQFIIDFVTTLGERVGRPITNQIYAMVGGSLGGNMGLRLSQRSTIDYPWLNTIVSWSPACTWGLSWARARSTPFEESGTYMDIVKFLAIQVPRGKVMEKENDDSRINFIYFIFGKDNIGGPQGSKWYRDGWPCKQLHIDAARLEREEVYSELLRLWYWRVAYEQLIFMHLEPNRPNGQPRIKNIQSRVLIGAGSKDDNFPESLWANTFKLSLKMINTEGSMMWFNDTGHSIHNERPHALANEISRFVAQPRPSGNIIETWTDWKSLGGPQLLPESIAVCTNENGLLEIAGINQQNKQVWVIRQQEHNSDIFDTWSEINSGGAAFDGKLAMSYLSHSNLDGTNIGKLRIFAKRTNGWVTDFTQKTANGSWEATDMGNSFGQIIGGAQAGTAVEVRVGNSFDLIDQNQIVRLHLLAAPLEDGHIHIRGQNTLGYPNGWWMNGKNIGNTRFSRTPVIARNHDGRLEIFNVDVTGRVMHIWETSPDIWIPEWQSLKGGVFTAGVAVGRTRDGRLEVFGRGTDSRLWRIWQTTPNGEWSDWAALGSEFAADSIPAVALNAWGGLQLFVRARDNSIQYLRQNTANGTWGGWVSLGGIVTSDPVLASNTNGSLLVFALGTDNRLFVKMQRTGNDPIPVSKARYAAVFDYTRAEFDIAMSEFNSRGYKLQAIDSYRINKNVRYNAIWTPTDEATNYAYAYKPNDFFAANNDKTSKGWRLAHIDTHLEADNSVRYNGVWKQGNSGIFYAYRYKWADFIKLNTERWKAGFRLQCVDTHTENGVTLFNAIWVSGTSGYDFVLGYKANDFFSVNNAKWKAGWRIQTIDTYVSNGELLYNATWKNEPGAGLWQLYGIDINTLNEQHTLRMKEGGLLKDIASYVINGQVRYHVIWHW